MFNPLSLWQDYAFAYWHIVDDGEAFCKAPLRDLQWCLPDRRDIEIHLCLDCWEHLSVRYVQFKLQLTEEGTKMESINDLWYEYNLWLEAHGLHDEEEPPEGTFIGYDDDGEEIHL